MSEQDEYGWVIEAASPPIYWDGRKVDSFTDDPSEAVRFARFEDAERVRCWLIAGGRFCKSVQHGWVSAAPPAGETARERIAELAWLEQLATLKAKWFKEQAFGDSRVEDAAEALGDIAARVAVLRADSGEERDA